MMNVPSPKPPSVPTQVEDRLPDADQRGDSEEVLENEVTTEMGMDGIRIEEVSIGGYECPQFVFSKNKERRIYRPWRRGLPIEYYDPRVLYLIGNRVGRAIKVDKNTMQHERRKYDRNCMEINLSKALLAMFSIKGRRYKIEYEGVYLLCLTCGKFRHCKDGCQVSIKGKNVDVAQGGSKNHNMKQCETSRENEGEVIGEAREGPWQVVQKQHRGRKCLEVRMWRKFNNLHVWVVLVFRSISY
ncbi:hypothetical protein KIW84_056595 [Lathyrus oleraceus]|uniref:Uncharacterized protein n=1 Tax=Pisum sativum TaxID=3888 RepID=A0A9D4X3M5_PEA|nr:hypothetical protein KIW84_056595 [Pisum sativum]